MPTPPHHDWTPATPPEAGVRRVTVRDLPVFVLGGHRPEGTPDRVVIDSEPGRLLERLRDTAGGGDVHLIGGPTTLNSMGG